ncbi:MAG: hypothetical protein KatS3mg129_2637 [Leptospiraceae bacterium]|nr:MAG: hypothetical protein KatS3mg129_2637 [Leptospiraceae bacterium]
MKKQPLLYYIFFFCVFFLLSGNKNLKAGNYLDIYGGSGRLQAMGGTGIAFVNDASSPYYNIAGLSVPNDADYFYSSYNSEEKAKKIDEHKNYLDYLLTTPTPPQPEEKRHEVLLNLNYVIPVTKVHLDYPIETPEIKKFKDHYAVLGLNFNLNKIINIKNKINFGLLAALPGSGNLVKVNDLNPTTHRFLQIGSSNERPSIFAGLSGEIWKNHLYMGIGITALSKGRGAMLMKDVDISPEKVTPNQQAILELKPLIMPVYGIQFHYGKIKTGIVYRRETYMIVDPLEARAQTSLLAIQFDFDLAMLDLYTPRSLGAGISIEVINDLLFAVDIVKEYWHLFELSRTKKIVYSPFKDEFLKKNINFQPFHFNDISIIKIGIEYSRTFSFFNRKFPLSFRAGYSYKPSPVPEMYDIYNWMDNDRAIYTAGIGYKIFPEKDGILQSPVIIDLAIENHQFKNRDVYKIDMDNFTKNPSYHYGGYAWLTSLSLKVYL